MDELQTVRSPGGAWASTKVSVDELQMAGRGGVERDRVERDGVRDRPRSKNVPVIAASYIAFAALSALAFRRSMTFWCRSNRLGRLLHG